MQLVDKSLPHATLSLSTRQYRPLEACSRLTLTWRLPEIFKLIVQIWLLYSAQKLLTATLPLCVLVVYIVQRIYLRTSRQLRLLDLESQAAVYSSFLESVREAVS